jgi:hypothetical protein
MGVCRAVEASRKSGASIRQQWLGSVIAGRGFGGTEMIGRWGPSPYLAILMSDFRLYNPTAPRAEIYAGRVCRYAWSSSGHPARGDPDLASQPHPFDSYLQASQDCGIVLRLDSDALEIFLLRRCE